MGERTICNPGTLGMDGIHATSRVSREGGAWRNQLVTWTFILPTACMGAQTMVEPTNVNPRLRRSLLKAAEIAVRAGPSDSERKRLGRRPPPTNRQWYSAKLPISSFARRKTPHVMNAVANTRDFPSGFVDTCKVHLWHIRSDAKTDGVIHRVAPGFGHALLSPMVAHAFEALRVGAAVWDHDVYWMPLHTRPALDSFEQEHGRDEERRKYNGRMFARVLAEKRAIRGDHAGLSDLFAPILARGKIVGILVCGPFARQRNGALGEGTSADGNAARIHIVVPDATTWAAAPWHHGPMRNVMGVMGVAVLLSACSSSEDASPLETADGAGGAGDLGGGGAAVDSGASAGGTKATGGTTGSGGSQAAGGTQDAGGSGGSTPAPDAMVLACADVVAGSGWQRITPPGDLGDTQAIALDPLNVGTLYVQMHKGGNGAHSPTDGIYKSSDCGSTWKVLPPGRNATDVAEAGKVVNIHSGSIVSIIVDPVEPGVMYTASNYGPSGIYKSVDGGVDWDQLIPTDLQQYMQYGGWFNALSVDPTDRLHLVGATHTGCTGTYAPNCLAETRDGGKTWRLVPAPASGNEQCGAYIHNANTMMYASGQNGAYVTTDDLPTSSAPTWTKVSQGANGADTGLLAYHASNGKYYLGSDYGVLEGSADFVTWTLDTNSPRPVPFVVGTGINLFASSRSAMYSTAKETTPKAWSTLPASGTPPTVAGRWLVYEETHHLLYSSSWGDGLYRLATP
jgi:hypothetical protein